MKEEYRIIKRLNVLQRKAERQCSALKHLLQMLIASCPEDRAALLEELDILTERTRKTNLELEDLARRLQEVAREKREKGEIIDAG